jgi:quinol-cytochrome oxidoreductase complex cytochrome b subunit
MSATINASTAVLLLMGSISLMLSQRESSSLASQALSVRVLLELAVVLVLFATYVCAAFAMRFYNHASFAMSLPVGSPERAPRVGLAATYVQRAGILYSWSLRCFLFTVPLAVGLLNPFVMPLAAVALVVVLALFDRAPASPES